MLCDGGDMAKSLPPPQAGVTATVFISGDNLWKLRSFCLYFFVILGFDSPYFISHNFVCGIPWTIFGGILYLVVFGHFGI